MTHMGSRKGDRCNLASVTPLAEEGQHKCLGEDRAEAETAEVSSAFAELGFGLFGRRVLFVFGTVRMAVTVGIGSSVLALLASLFEIVHLESPFLFANLTLGLLPFLFHLLSRHLQPLLQHLGSKDEKEDGGEEGGYLLGQERGEHDAEHGGEYRHDGQRGECTGEDNQS